MNNRQIKNYLAQGYPPKAIDNTISYLKENGLVLFNLAYLGNGDYRIMGKNSEGKLNSIILHWGNLLEDNSKIIEIG